MRRLPLAAALGLLSACPAHAPAPEMPATRPAPAPRAARVEIRDDSPPAAAAPLLEPEALTVTLSAIGYPSAPKISRKARAKNRAALKLHRKGDYPASRIGFEEALEASPDHDMARFNLACALSRLGELEGARAQLETVLHRDLLRFQLRWRGPDADPDLEALRTSRHAPGLDALVEALRVAYDDAHDRGVAAYLYREPPTMAETDFADNPVSKGASTLISGIWLHTERRFVPLGRGGTVALLDLPNRRLLRADVHRDEKHCHWDLYSSESLASTDPDPTAAIRGHAVDATASERVEDWEPVPRPALHFGGPPEPAAQTWIDVRPHGGVYRAPPPEGYALSRKRLTVPGRDDPFVLDRRYEAVFATGDPDAPVFLLARRANEGDGITFVFDATVSRLDPSTGELERLAHAAGNAWIAIGPDDSVYVESDDEVQRWPTADAASAEPTMAGLHITMPFGGPSCMCCG